MSSHSSAVSLSISKKSNPTRPMTGWSSPSPRRRRVSSSVARVHRVRHLHVPLPPHRVSVVPGTASILSGWNIIDWDSCVECFAVPGDWTAFRTFRVNRFGVCLHGVSWTGEMSYLNSCRIEFWRTSSSTPMSMATFANNSGVVLSLNRVISSCVKCSSISLRS